MVLLKEGEKLKKFRCRAPVMVLLLLAGLIFPLSIISAQEQEGQSPDAPFRAAEQVYVLGEETPAAAQTSGSSVWAVIRMILALILASIAIYGVVFLVKRASKKTDSDDPYLKVLASAHLGLKRYAHVVSVGGKAWLVGAGEGGVNLISEINEKEVLDAMFLEDTRKNTAGNTGRFQDFFAMLRRAGIQPGGRAGTDNSGTDEVRRHRERLKGL